jgi:ABC-type transport system substrate-binding protein
MDERALRGMIDEVKSGCLSRRHFVQTMVGLGLTAPLAAQMLASAGVAQAQSKLAYKPTKRGGGGALKVLWWQGATLLNPHFATGTKDQDGSRIIYEPLASWDPDGNLAPILAAETEMDAVKRAAQFIRMNDMIIQNGVVIPVNWRNGVAAASSKLRGMDLTGWDSNLWRLPYWYKA